MTGFRYMDTVVNDPSCDVAQGCTRSCCADIPLPHAYPSLRVLDVGSTGLSQASTPPCLGMTLSHTAQS
jgi:hypothetical protein